MRIFSIGALLGLCAPVLLGQTAATTAKVDAFGRALLLEDVLQVPLLLGGVEANGELDFIVGLAREQEAWPRAQGFVDLDAACSFRYHQENASATSEQYDAFLATPEGEAWVVACEASHLADPAKAFAYREAALAYLELQLGVVALTRIGDRWPDVASGVEPTAEVQSELRKRARIHFPHSKCLVAEGSKKVDFTRETWLEDLTLQIGQLAQAGGCQEVLEATTKFELSSARSSKLVDPALDRMLTTLFGDGGKKSFAVFLLQLEGKALARAQGALDIEVTCATDYLDTHPGQVFEDYRKFRGGEAGARWHQECALKQLAPPEAERSRDAFLATVEIGLALPALMSGMDNGRAKRGLPPIDYDDPVTLEFLTDPAKASGIHHSLKKGLATLHCAVAKTVEKSGIEVFVVENKTTLGTAIQAHYQACEESPAP